MPGYHSQVVTIPTRTRGGTILKSQFSESLCRHLTEGQRVRLGYASVGKSHHLSWPPRPFSSKSHFTAKKTKVLLALVFNDSNKIIILFLNSKSLSTRWSLERSQDIAAPTTSMVQAILVYPRPRLPGDVCICYTGSVTALSSGALFSRLHLRRKASLYHREFKPFCNPPALIFPRWLLTPVAPHNG